MDFTATSFLLSVAVTTTRGIKKKKKKKKNKKIATYISLAAKQLVLL